MEPNSSDISDKYIRDTKIKGRKKSETTKHMFEETTQKCELYILMFGTFNDTNFSKLSFKMFGIRTEIKQSINN